MMGRFVFLQNVSAAQPEPSALAAVCENSFLNRSKLPNSSSITLAIVFDGF
jgi:hypothetical protein